MSAREMARILEGEAFLNSQRFRERAEYFQKVGQWLEQQPERVRTLPENWWSYPPPAEMLQRLQPPEPERAQPPAQPRSEPERGAGAAQAARPAESIKATWAQLEKGGPWHVRAPEGLPEGSKILVQRKDGRLSEVTIGEIVIHEKNGVTVYQAQRVVQAQKEPRERPAEQGAEQRPAQAPARAASPHAPAEAQASPPPAPARSAGEAVGAPARKNSLDRIIAEAEAPRDMDRWHSELHAQVQKLTPHARASLAEHAERRRNEVVEEVGKLPRVGLSPDQIQRVRSEYARMSAITTRLEAVVELASERTREPARTRAAAAEMAR